MLKRWIVYLAALLGCVVFHLAYRGWISWLLLTAAVWLPWVSLLLSLPAMCLLSVSIGCRGTLTACQQERMSIKLRCPLPAPAQQCHVLVERPLTGECWVLALGDFLPTEHAGALNCTLKKCKVYDYLGLFAIPVRRKKNGVVTVRPVEAGLAQPPQLQQFLSRAWRPKPGGGFAENHELRLFRPGDSLNQVHWKLTAKTGKLMIREPMEALRGKALLTIDLKGSPQQLDSYLGQLLWLGKYLLSQGLSYELRALTGQGVTVCHISDAEQLYHQLDLLLACTPAEEGTLQGGTFGAAWQYHIGGGTDAEE